MVKRWALPAVLLLMSPFVSAHDYWLEPKSSFPSPGTHFDVSLFVGMDLTPEKEHPYQTERVESYVVKGSGATDAKPVEGRKPAFSVPLGKSGDVLVALVRKVAHIELTAEEFNDYLAHEGLPHILQARQNAGIAGKPAREKYTRYLKAFGRAGSGDGQVFTEPVGHTLEIVPAKDPLSLKAGEVLQVKVLFEGKPLAGGTLFAYGRAGKEIRKATYSCGEDGTAEIRIPGPGIWSIRLIHMRECVGCKDADYESFWTGITFEVR
ncbi:MAG: DUF4198 domain-containing protein [Acidobacteria bacterium]|nr:DUF4198 domain-containing protein [Acidobacteriota bacterium]